MSLKKILIAISVVTSIIIISVVYVLTAKYNQSKENIPQAYMLGEATEKGYIGVELTYDKECPNIILKSPTGVMYNSRTADRYDLNSVSKTVTMLADSGELGKWTVSFSKMSNDKISYKFVNTPSPTLYLKDVAIEQTGDDYYVAFCPVQGSTVQQNCRYSVVIEAEGHTYALDDGKVKINERTRVAITVPKEAYNSGASILRVSVKSLAADQSAATEELKINLIENAISAFGSSDNEDSDNDNNNSSETSTEASSESENNDSDNEDS